MSNTLSKLTVDLVGKYYPLPSMDKKVRQQLVNDHFLFMSGNHNLNVAGMKRDWLYSSSSLKSQLSFLEEMHHLA